MLVDGSDWGKERLRTALGLGEDRREPQWPLPNIKPTTAEEFWGWQTSYSYTAKAHVMSQKVEGTHADIFIFRMPDVYNFVDGGFAVVVWKNYPDTTIKYFEWRACEHKFKCIESRNCYRKYECSICHKGYDEHSD